MYVKFYYVIKLQRYYFKTVANIFSVYTNT